MLTKDEILKADDIITESIDVPEWNGKVIIKTLTGSERDSFEQSVTSEPGKTNLADVRAKLCSLIIVDKDGNQLFNKMDVVALSKKSGAALDRIFEAGLKLNSMAPGDVEDLAKNSEAARSEGSISV